MDEINASGGTVAQYPKYPMSETDICYEPNDPSKTMVMTTCERKWHTQLLRLAEERADEVVLHKLPEDNDGCMVARIPRSWLKIKPTRKLTAEETEMYKARALRNFHGIYNGDDESEGDGEG